MSERDVQHEGLAVAPLAPMNDDESKSHRILERERERERERQRERLLKQKLP